MTQAPLRLPLRPRETLTSFVSRHAAFHSVGFNALCLDFGSSSREVFLGTETAIRLFSEKLNASAAEIRQYAFSRRGLDYRLGGQQVRNHDATRQHLRVCPSCIRDDLQALGKHIPPQLRPYGRAEWSLRSIRSCQVHGRALEVLSSTAGQYPYDFAAAIGPHLYMIQGLVRASAPLPPSGLEGYIIARLAGLPVPQGVIADMPLYAVANLSEMMGMVAIHGAQVSTLLMTEPDWHRAGDVGFSYLASDEEGVTSFFSEVAPPRAKRTRQWGPRAAFGRLYTWLSSETQDPSYDPIRNLMRDYCWRSMALDGDNQIFGKPGQHRQIHTLRSIALTAELHPKRLKKVLLACGRITPEQAELSDGDIIVPAHHIAPIVMAASDAVSVAQAAILLNVSRGQVEALISTGILAPFVRPGIAKIGSYGLLRTDLSNLLARLTERCLPVEKIQEGRVSIEAASRRVHACSSSIVRLLLNDELDWKGKLAGVDGLRSILVDVQEVRSKITRTPLDGMSLREAERRLSTSYHVLHNLVQEGILTVRKTRNPVTNYPQDVIDLSEIERFQETYVSLRSLARGRRKSSVHTKRELAKEGVAPAFAPEKIGATFYRRDASKGM